MKMANELLDKVDEIQALHEFIQGIAAKSTRVSTPPGYVSLYRNTP